MSRRRRGAELLQRIFEVDPLRRFRFGIEEHGLSLTVVRNWTAQATEH